MSKIYTSNRLESLCQTMAENIRKPEKGVFEKELIITQTAGMNAWLKTELARRNGVFANFEFQNQDGFLAELYLLLFGKRLQNNSDTIKYRIYDCLSSAAFKDAFAEVALYYENNELRRFQLSAKIADLFDQYQLYRPEMIENWEKGILSTENSDEKWQLWLWKELKTDSRSKIKEKIIGQFEVQKDLIRKNYPEISLFGISVYTRFHLDFFKVLAKYINVNFYQCLPTGKNEFQNQLLISFGTKARELAGMFPIEDFETIENESDSLLARIQNRILYNTTNSEYGEDDSVQINSCYTPVREVECLYNYLLDLFENDRNLKPSDVLVMTTDINKYAPFVKAVFRNAPVNIPFQVSGAASNNDDSITAALEQILGFTEDDLTSEKVISLLEHKRIKQRFGIQDCNYIRTTIRKANIRFGRQNRAEDDTQYVSWKYGLDKILLGYAMLTDEAYPVSDDLSLYPFKDTEASGSHDLLRLKAFVDTLETVIDAQNEPKTLADWKLYLFNMVFDKMVYCDDFVKDDRAELSSVYRALSFIDYLEFKDKVPFGLFLEELKTKLFTESRESKLNTGRVTLSSPIPVRGLPYKVICFMGLNNDIFPGKDRFMGFDLLGEKYIAGDRNKKETDKYLFLDTLLAAREKIYLSYIGQSVKDNTPIPPSIVVDTLLDYLGLNEIVATHPLHGFSSKYQKDNKRLFTYLYAEEACEIKTKDTVAEEFTDVSVYSLIKFFEHPIEWYFKAVLGIVFEDNTDTIPETELFELDHLQKWQVKNDLLRLDKEGLKPYLQKGIKEGQLPLKNLGRSALDQLAEETMAIRQTYEALTRDKEESNIVIDLTLDNIRITGTINGVYNRHYIACTFSKSLQKDQVRSFLKTLLLCAGNEIDAAFLINKDGESTSINIVSSENAKLKIKDLLFYFLKGMQSPLKFTLSAAQPPTNSGISTESVLSAINYEANGNYIIAPNRYLQILFQEGYFKDFNEIDLDELKTIAGLLNLKTA